MNFFKKHKTIISAYLVVALVAGSFVYFGLHPQTAQAACTPGTGWGYCDTITIDHTKVSTVNGTALTGGFVVEASSTDAHLATVGNGGYVQNTTTQTGSSYTGTIPADLQFSTSSTFSTLLPGWEYDNYNSATGNFIVWLNMGNSVSTSTDTVIYEQVGKSSVTTFQGNVNSTWNSNYLLVQHYGTASSVSLVDSTSNANTFNIYNGPFNPGAGFISGGLYNDYNYKAAVSVGNFTPSSFSISGWWQSPNINNPYEVFADQDYNAGVSTTSNWNLSPVDGYHMPTFNIFHGSTKYTLTNTIPGTSNGYSINANTWYYVAATYDGTTMNFWVNGYHVSTTTSVSLNTNSIPITLTNFGSFANGGYGIGTIDELHFANVAYSSDWISTEYNNQLAPDKANYGSGGFYTIGTWSSGGGGGGTPTPHARATIQNTDVIINKGQIIIN